MQVKAKLKYLRMAPKKVRLVANLIKGLKTDEAIHQLGFLNKAAKRPVLKLINSAVSNAEHNFNLKKDNLFIKEIKVDLAGALKRWQPKAHGRATPILKRLSHIIVILEETVPTKIKAKKTKKPEGKLVKLSSLEEVKAKIKPEKVPIQAEAKPEGHDKEINKEIHDVRMEGKHRHKQNEDKREMKKSKGFIKKLFSRKAG
ncbi:MAG: 50S ribosomal protein L22 [Candidatus Parcubacteria bacterium]|nr:50S ribosomal protein L22 [Candidatus Parcubacteria bacterium]